MLKTNPVFNKINNLRDLSKMLNQFNFRITKHS